MRAVLDAFMLDWKWPPRASSTGCNPTLLTKRRPFINRILKSISSSVRIISNINCLRSKVSHENKLSEIPPDSVSSWNAKLEFLGYLDDSTAKDRASATKAHLCQPGFRKRCIFWWGFVFFCPTKDSSHSVSSIAGISTWNGCSARTWVQHTASWTAWEKNRSAFFSKQTKVIWFWSWRVLQIKVELTRRIMQAKPNMRHFVH